MIRLKGIARRRKKPAWIVSLIPSRSWQGGCSLSVTHRRTRYRVWIKELRTEWIVGRRQAMHGLLNVFDYKLDTEAAWKPISTSASLSKDVVHYAAREAVEQCWKGWVTYSYQARGVR